MHQTTKGAACNSNRQPRAAEAWMPPRCCHNLLLPPAAAAGGKDRPAELRTRRSRYYRRTQLPAACVLPCTHANKGRGGCRRAAACCYRVLCGCLLLLPAPRTGPLSCSHAGCARTGALPQPPAACALPCTHASRGRGWLPPAAAAAAQLLRARPAANSVAVALPLIPAPQTARNGRLRPQNRPRGRQQRQEWLVAVWAARCVRCIAAKSGAYRYSGKSTAKGPSGAGVGRAGQQAAAPEAAAK